MQNQRENQVSEKYVYVRGIKILIKGHLSSYYSQVVVSFCKEYSKTLATAGRSKNLRTSVTYTFASTEIQF